MNRTATVLFLSTALGSGACTSPESSSGVPHLPFPQITNLSDAGVLTSPQIVTITFKGDTLASDIESWTDWVASSAWLAAVGSDYGVGPGAHLANYHVAYAAPDAASQADIAQMLQDLLADGGLTSPVPNVVYMIYYPAPSATNLELGNDKYCDNFSGYHWSTTVAGAPVAFAVVGRCQTFWPGVTEIQAVERTAAHELIESATDPVPRTGTFGFYLPVPAQGDWTPSTSPWGAARQTEVGDLCTGTQVYQDGPYVAQRIWSNSAVRAGVDPCIPAQQLIQAYNVGAPSAWVPVAPGTTVSIPLEGWAVGDMATAEFVVSAELDSASEGFTWKLSTPSSVTQNVPMPTDAGVDESDGAVPPADAGASATVLKTFPTIRNGQSFKILVTSPPSASPGNYAAFRVEMRTQAQVTSPSALDGDWFHYVAVGAYVPAPRLGPQSGGDGSDEANPESAQVLRNP